MRSAKNPMKHSLRLLPALVVLTGCGGGGGGSSSASSSSPTPVADPNTGPGQAAVSVVWPSRARGLSAAANSVVLVVLRGSTTLQTRLVARPDDGAASVVSFANLPLGTLTIRMSAYASADGSGSPLSTGTSALSAAQGTPTPVAVAMDPVAASLSLSTRVLGVPENATLGLAVTATDATGTTLPDAVAGVRWTSDAPAIASVSGSGASATVTGVAVGQTTIRATLVRADGTTVSAEVAVTVSATGGTVTVH